MPPRSLRSRLPVALGASLIGLTLVGAGVVGRGAHGVTDAARRTPVAPRVAAPHPQIPHHHRGAPAERTSTGAVLETAATSTTDNPLEQKLRDRLSRATAERFGIVVDAAGVGRVAAINGRLAMRPASSQKLFTTLPLLLNAPTHRLRTTVWAGAKPHHGVVHGNVIVRVSGDPSLLRGALVRLAREVRAQGIRRFTGRFMLDIGSLPLRTTEDGWKSDFVPNELGPLSPFPVRYDQLRHDSWYLGHPTQGNVHIFRGILAAAGVRVDGTSRIVRGSSPKLLLASHSSATMARLIRHTLQWSDNFFAEQLLDIEGGHATINTMEDAAGIPGTSYATDGSGLSYLDRETVAGEVALLHYAHRSSAATLLRDALPVACRSGTLLDEFCGTIAAGKVFAKTGTLAHSKALAGYTTDAKGRLVTFAILASGVRNLDAASTAFQRAVLVLRNYSG